MRMHALVCRSVWSTALLGAILAGCGGETGVNREGSEPSESEAVFESILPTADSQGDSGQPPDRQVQAAGMSCPSATATWYQQQTAWNLNVNTEGKYYCTASVPSTSDGFGVSVRASGAERNGTAQLRCTNGTWQGVSASCDGRVVSTTIASGGSLVCAHSDPVRAKWISWYQADYKRCADPDGLEWWVYQYNNSTDCLASTNYNGYGSKDACFHAGFINSAINTYNEAQALGHITPGEEAGACGPRAAYPWTNVVTYGAQCKYRP